MEKKTTKKQDKPNMASVKKHKNGLKGFISI